MTIQEFLGTILKDVDVQLAALPADKVFDLKTKELSVVRDHVLALTIQANKPKEDRVKSILHSSWKVVTKLGPKYNLFKSFWGDQDARDLIKAFLGD